MGKCQQVQVRTVPLFIPLSLSSCVVWYEMVSAGVSERFVICFVGKCEKLLVASAVAKGSEMVRVAVGVYEEQTAHFLRTIAVGSGESSCKYAVCIGLYLCAYYGDVTSGKEW